MANFVHRTRELAALTRWWETQQRVAVVWGRQRVGKTAMPQHFATGRTAVFLTGTNRGEPGELSMLSDRVRSVAPGDLRNLTTRPSAVRQMRALQEERAPLYGRFDLALQLQSFGPHEGALMLPDEPSRYHF